MISAPQSVEQLFKTARERSPADRSAFLDHACQNFPEIRRLVEQRFLAEEEQERSTVDWSGPPDDTGTSPSGSSFDRANSGRFQPGQIIAQRFTVIRYIARGGMGEVYEVEDRLLQGVHVALKMILPEIANDANTSRRFEQEVLLARKVTHPNLCPIYDIARSDNPSPPFLFLTMKLLTGETLSSRLRRTGPIPREEVIQIFRQMVAGLAAIHDAGIIHRDIKPNNVMLDYSAPELCLSIMDFGLARLHEQDQTINTLSMVAGTPGYMAPEILMGQGPSQATDFFALGVLMHQVLTGERPQFGADSLSLEPSPALDTADAPPEFVQVVKDFLSNDPKVRCIAFDHLQSSLISNRPPGPWISTGTYGSSRTRLLSRRQFAIGSALAACAAAGGIAWKWDSVDDMLHPLPVKRFVALLGWPTPTDERLQSTIAAVIDAIGTDLARAESHDRNLFIIPHHIGRDVASLAQVNDVRESLGANLVLSVSAVQGGTEPRLILRLLDPAVSRILRQKSIDVPMNNQLSLPQKAVSIAAGILGIKQSELGDDRNKVGTGNSEAYTAYQAAESLANQPNDVGLDAAIEKYKQAIELDPHYALANAKLARMYFRSYILHSDPATLILARANCQAALSENPNLVDAHLALASVLDWTGDKPGAIREISKALSIDPRDPRAMLIQGQEFTRCNRWQEAEDTFARLQTARPNFWLGYEELGIAYGFEGKYTKAVEEFRAANRAAPQRTVPLANLSLILLHMGHLDDALDFARKSFSLAPNDPGAVAMAAALRCRGKFDEALSYSSKAVELNADDPGNWLELADSYSRVRGRQVQAREAFGRAAKLLEQATQTNPTDGPKWMSLAFAQAKTGELDKSPKSLDKADANFAGDIDSQLLKVRTLELLGRRDEALTTATECLARGATQYQFQFMPDINGLRSDSRFKSLHLPNNLTNS